jgi:hypothetical protein
LLNRIYFVRKFLESIKTENGANLQISSTMRPYKEIKNVKISTVAKSLDIQKSYTGYINKIKVVQAEHGGEKQ